MRTDTSEAFARLVTLYVGAIKNAGGEIPEEAAQQLTVEPLRACELLCERALALRAIDAELDAGLAAIYEAMDATDARSAVDERAAERIARAFMRAQRGRKPRAATGETSYGAEGEGAPASAGSTADVTAATDAAATETAAAESAPKRRRGRKPKTEREAEERERREKADKLPEASPDETLSVDQALAILNVSRPTIYKLIESGRLPAEKRGRSWRISAAAVIERARA